MALQVANVVIANGASLSGPVDIGNYKLVGLVVPSAWTSGDITFAAAVTPGLTDNLAPADLTYYPVYDAAGTELTITNGAGTSRLYAIAPTAFAGTRYLKVRSGLVGAAVNQGAARTITLVLDD
jgi:hypothetical protein